MTREFKQLRRTFIYLAILAMLAGCGLGEALEYWGDPVDMRPADLVGVWEAGTEHKITFETNGDFSATNLPYDAFEDLTPQDFDSRPDYLDGSGIWSLARDDQSSASPTDRVKLEFKRLGDSAVTAAGLDLAALRQNGKVFLMFSWSDGQGSESFARYQKCTSGCG